MARYIDTGKAIEKISTITIKGGCTDAYEAGINKGLDIATEIINHTPTAYVEPVRHGKWIWKDNEPDNYVCICSNCNAESEHLYNYCPNCGVRMDKEN